jgi:hypothetical protein
VGEQGATQIKDVIMVLLIPEAAAVEFLPLLHKVTLVVSEALVL